MKILVTSSVVLFLLGCQPDHGGQPLEVVDRPADVGEWWEFDQTTEERFAIQRRHYDQMVSGMGGANPPPPSSAGATPVGVRQPKLPCRSPDLEHARQLARQGTSRFAFAGLTTTGGLSIDLSQLSGDGGGLLQNANRWRRQFGLAPISELPPNLPVVTVLGQQVSVVEVQGTFKGRELWNCHGQSRHVGHGHSPSGPLPQFEYRPSSVSAQGVRPRL